MYTRSVFYHIVDILIVSSIQLQLSSVGRQIVPCDTGPRCHKKLSTHQNLETHFIKKKNVYNLNCTTVKCK